MPSSKCVDPQCLEYLGGAGGWQKEVQPGGGEGLNWKKEMGPACLCFNGTFVRDSPSDTESSQHPLCSRCLVYARDVTCMLGIWTVSGRRWRHGGVAAMEARSTHLNAV